MLQTGSVLFVFGFLLLVRGLLDVFRADAVAEANRGLNARINSGRSGAMLNQRRHAEKPADVRRQGKRVLWFSALTLAVSIGLMALSSTS